MPNPLILISDQSHRAPPVSINICLVSPQFLCNILLKHYGNIIETLRKYYRNIPEVLQKYYWISPLFSSSPIRYKSDHRSDQAWPLMMDEEKEEVWLDSPQFWKAKAVTCLGKLASVHGKTEICLSFFVIQINTNNAKASSHKIFYTSHIYGLFIQSPLEFGFVR